LQKNKASYTTRRTSGTFEESVGEFGTVTLWKKHYRELLLLKQFTMLLSLNIFKSDRACPVFINIRT
jgi:hypothetical protein